MQQPPFPSYFISHGGGPWPYMEGEFRRRFDLLEAALQALPAQLPRRPEAVLMISGHWEAAEFRVMAAAQPGMLYDYSGFPPHTYEVRYAAPGSPALAQRVETLLQAAGLPVQQDRERGFDHGAFATMAAIYPQADMPLVQLSLQADYDPLQHLLLGRALAPLRHEGVLIIGSGLSYHNLQVFGPAARESSRAFDDWLQQTLCVDSPQQRWEKLQAWQQAPAARQAHPSEDHLLPLMVAVGAAEHEAGCCVYHEQEFFGGISVSNFRFG